jgi:DNA modification methylase
MKLSQHDINDLIERLQNGENLPDDYKYKLFPVKQKEYELVYGGKMRREDILSNEDGVFPVPLQIEKIFNGKREQWKDGWKNIIAFGDNLQFLKTIYENKDPLIKNKVKGKVKLIYIDPPFATESDFKTSSGNKAYTDKSKGADFVEFIRRRLILAKEILAEDGSIFVHLDWKKVHYIKAVLDEVFNENFLVNEIIWHYADNFQGNVKGFATNHNTILWYSKTNTYTANKIFIPLAKITKRDKRVWSSELGKLVSARDDNGSLIYEDFTEKKADDVWEIGQSSTTKKASAEFIDYPTQKPEELLKRIILAASNEGDLVMDFFGGSGTTVAVAEKLKRKWVTCDIGKLAFYTIQRRLLNIETSKSFENNKKQYSKSAKNFITLNTGHYDLAKIFDLKQKEYSDFVMNLFEVEPKKKTINGIQIDGEKKDGFNVIVWQYWKFKNSSVDEEFLQNLNSHIGNKAGKRVYIIAPASYVDFISDYYEIDKVRYYFLKVPYQIIRELHKVQFKKFRQPQSKSNVNDLEDAIGFHFIRQPEVKSELKEKSGEYHITISKFLSDFSEEDTDRDMANFESLAMILIDKNFDGETFDMDTYYFAEDLLPRKKKKTDEEVSVENIKEGLKHLNQIPLPSIPKKECGKKLMLVYVDIYGNEFKEEFKLK